MGMKDLLKKMREPISSNCRCSPSPSAAPDEHLWIRRGPPEEPTEPTPDIDEPIDYNPLAPAAHILHHETHPPPAASRTSDDSKHSQIISTRDLTICPECGHKITIDVITTLVVEA